MKMIESEEVCEGEGHPSIRVLMLSIYFPPQYSGAAKQAITLAKRLRELGHQIEFVTVRWKGLSEEDVIDGFRVHRVREGSGTKHKEFRLWWELLKYTWKRRNDFDVFHSHGAYYQNSIVGLISKLLGWKCLVKASLEDNDLHGLGRSLTGKVHQVLLGFVDRYIAISANLEQEFLSSGLPKDRVILLPNGVDTNRFRPAGQDEKLALREEFSLPPTRPIMLTVGVFDRRKNIHWLIEQWVNNQAFGTNGFLLAIGPQSRDDPNGVLITSLKRMADTHSDNIRILEEVDDIERYYRAADIFVLPSHGEGMPNVLLEAMASGLSCIATQVSGTADLIHDRETGFTYALNDSEELEKAISLLLDSPDGYIGQNSRLLIERRFGLKVIAKGYEDIYRKLLS
jgi:glycosyltransferase involved in cell wall biosynthesis